MPNRNKARGKYFEEKIVKILQKIFRLNKHQLYRASFSGARNTVEYNGDITFPDPEKYPIIIECKYYQSMTLDHFFPACNSYIDKWLIQLNKEKKHFIKQFNKEPLTLIIAGKPYNNHHHNIILENQVILEDLEEVWGIKEYIKFFSNKLSRHYILLDFYYIERVFEAFGLLDRRLEVVDNSKILINNKLIDNDNNEEFLDDIELKYIDTFGYINNNS